MLLRIFQIQATVAVGLAIVVCISCSSNTVSQPLPRPTSLSRTDAQLATSAPTSYKATVLADTPLAYYRLDETSGSTVADSSGYAHTGSISGGVSYAVGGALGNDSDAAMGFNGSNAWITAAAPTITSTYTLEAWVKTQAVQGFILDLSPQQLVFEKGRFKFGSGGHYLWTYNSSYGDNLYHYVVATYDGRMKRLYVDGIQANSVLDSAVIATPTTYIARYSGGSPYALAGSLDEVAIYGKALTAAQVLNHFNAAHGSLPSPSPSPSHSSTPTPSPSPSPSSTPSTTMKHVLTADYVAGTGTKVSPSTLAPWLTWASIPWQSNTSVRAAGIKAMYYTNPNRLAPGDSMWTTDESAFAHDCSGARILTSSYGEFLMDPSSSGLRTNWQSYIAYESKSVTWDAIFEDNANDVVGATTLPCGYTTAAWLASSQGENAFQLPTPLIYNGLQIPGQISLNASPNVVGGMEEGCYSLNATLTKAFDSYWTQRENTEITMALEGKLFYCYGMDTNNASTSADSRLYSYASFLLTYSPTSSVLWEYYSTPSGFHVMPESTLVALDPLVPTPSTIDGLLLSTSVYGREYAHCYVAKVYAGPCAAVVNTSRYTSNPYPYGNKYKHTLVLSGAGVLDGGSISENGPTPPSTLGNLESVIVFQ